MPQNLQLIVLNTIKYKDTNLIVQGYSNLVGRQSLVLRAGKSSKNYAALSQLHPLSIIDAELVRGAKGEMGTIKEYTSAYQLSDIRCNIHKCSIAIFMSEIIYRTIKEVEPNLELYNFISRSILQLEALESGSANFHIWFIVQLSRHLGYSPVDNRSEEKPIFEIISGGFTNGSILSDLYFTEKSSMILSVLLNATPEMLCSLKISKNERFNFIQDMIRYLSFHTGYQIEVNSLGILHEVFE